jgi:hypothetical protein
MTYLPFCWFGKKRSSPVSFLAKLVNKFLNAMVAAFFEGGHAYKEA